MISEMASLAGETAPEAQGEAESVAPSRLRDINGHKGMHPIHTNIAGIHLALCSCLLLHHKNA